MRCLLVAVFALGSLVTRAEAEVKNVSLGAGAGMVRDLMWQLRYEAIDDQSSGDDGATYGGRAGVEYWRGSGDQGFAFPIGWYGGVRAGPVRSLLGGGIGLFALDVRRDATGFGIAPYLGATLVVDVGNGHTVALDVRATRHLLLGADDVTTWNVLVAFGTTPDR